MSFSVAKRPPRVSGSAEKFQWSKAVSFAVPLAPAAATGTVELYDGTTRLATATLSGGRASLRLEAKSLPVGRHTLVVRYLGSATHAASQDTVTVTVTKGKPKVQVDRPDRIRAGEKAKIRVEVTAPGYDPTGKVRIVLKGAGDRDAEVLDLDDGLAVARIRVDRPGTYDVQVTYLGDKRTEDGEDSTTLRVTRRR